LPPPRFSEVLWQRFLRGKRTFCRRFLVRWRN